MFKNKYSILLDAILAKTYVPLFTNKHLFDGSSASLIGQSVHTPVVIS